ncbi:acyl-homoserine-lactone synthase [Methylobacterium sp. EM32]|uniref:acyl-homoserine-lactone synthase n=1 Tax=Methylobacterium sp. EM32 TaxID=3163481 RepID=UPI0033B2667A
MITVIDSANYHQSAHLLDAMYQFRHRVFVDIMKWEACRKPDGRDIDQFDGPDCIHVAALDGEAVISYSRLLPTTRPHLQSHVYPELLQGRTAPTGPHILEWTRCAAAPWRRPNSLAADPNAGRQFLAVTELTPALGLTGYLAQVHPTMITKLTTMGWDVEPLALPTRYDGHLVVPIHMIWTPQTADATRRAFGLTGTAYDVLPHALPAPRNHPTHYAS